MYIYKCGEHIAQCLPFHGIFADLFIYISRSHSRKKNVMAKKKSFHWNLKLTVKLLLLSERADSLWLFYVRTWIKEISWQFICIQHSRDFIKVMTLWMKFSEEKIKSRGMQKRNHILVFIIKWNLIFIKMHFLPCIIYEYNLIRFRKTAAASLCGTVKYVTIFIFFFSLHNKFPLPSQYNNISHSVTLNDRVTVLSFPCFNYELIFLTSCVHCVFRWW